MRYFRLGTLVSGTLISTLVSGCGPAGDDRDSGGDVVRTQVQAISNLGDAEEAIRTAWRKFNYCPNSSSCLGSPYHPTSDTQFVPGTGTAAAFRRYEESIGYPSVGVYSDLFGAVILPSWKFDAWLALAGQTSQDEGDLFDYIGMPRPDGTFERGIIDRSGAAVTGHIYSRYLIYADDFGDPVGPEVRLASGQWMQEFDGGEIYWKDGIGAFALKAGDALDKWKAEGGATGPIGFPVAELIELDETVPVTNGSVTTYLEPQIARFENGGVYYYPTTGAFALTGDFLSKFEDVHGGVSGFLGFPISDLKTVPATGDEYVDFQDGILIKHLFSTGQTSILTFSQFDFYFNKMQGRADDCVVNACGGGEMRPDITVKTPNGTEIDERLPFKQGNWDPQFKESWSLDNQVPMSDWYADVTVHVTEVDDWPDPDDNMGTVSYNFNINNLWGFHEDYNDEHRHDQLSVWFNLRNNLPYGDLPFRQEQWWHFDNFTTDELSYEQYAQTFADVSAADEWWKDPLNVLLYEIVYRKLAKNGNCFGMTVESVYSALGMSAYPQPLNQYLPDLAPGAKPDGSTQAQRNLINELNVKMGYQLGSDFLGYTLLMFTTGLTHEPAANFDLSQIAHFTGNFPLFSLSGYWGNRGHSVRPYHWSTTDEGDALLTHFIKVADPNHPWADHQDDDIITIERYLEFSDFEYRDYRGSSWEGARLFFQPLPTFSKQPYTPFGLIGQAIDQLSSLIVSSDADVQQVSDDQGRNLFAANLSGPPSSWDDIVQDDQARVPNIAPVPMSDGPDDEATSQLFISKSDGATHHYNIAGAQDGVTYQAVFTSAHMAVAFDVPGTEGKAERLSALEINKRQTSISLEMPDNAPNKKIKMLVTGAEKSRWAEFSDLSLEAGQRIEVSLKNGGYDVVIENDGPDTTATLRVKHGKDKEAVDVGEIDIPSGETSTQFQLPETKLTLENEVHGNNGWLVDIPIVTLEAFSFSGEEILGIDWSNDDQQTWTSLPGKSSSFAYDTEGESTMWYAATDQDFNAEAPKSYYFKIDTRVPVVEVSTGAGEFTRVDTFVADVTVEDPLPGSGIFRFDVDVDGTQAVAGQEVDIFWFSLGSHTLAGEAEDYAGWITHESGQFTVMATLEDLPETIRELNRRNEISGLGVTNSLVRKAEAALASKQRGNLTAARNQLEALVNEINALASNKISDRGAALLVGDIYFVLASL